jgi:hypothetical protein
MLRPYWLDLEELDLIGQSQHPLNERRLQGLPYAQEVAYDLSHPTTSAPASLSPTPLGHESQ